MRALLLKLPGVLLGLFLFSLGSYLGIQANVGLGAWEAFGVGVSGALPALSYGQVTVLTGLAILVIDVMLGEKIGVATILNTLLVGTMVDLLNAVNLVPKLSSFAGGIALLLLGQVVLSLGSFFYIRAGLGSGPRDALMVALGKRLNGVPIGVVRAAIEGTALLIGWALGAKVGVGTVIAVLGIGFVMQWTFRLLRFDVRAVRHESLAATVRGLLAARR